MSEETIFQQLEICQKQLGARWSEISALKEAIERQSDQLAALREELATSKRNEHNSEVAYKAAIEKQEELRGERNELSLQASRLKVDNENYDRLLVRKSNQCDAVQQRLADAERRNSDCAAKLELTASMIDDDERGNRFAEVCRLAVAALNPNPESDKETWNDMVDLPAHEAGAKYRMILDDVQQDCVELEMEGRKRWFYGEENGAFPEDEIQAWLPINPNPEAASHDE